LYGTHLYHTSHLEVYALCLSTPTRQTHKTNPLDIHRSMFLPETILPALGSLVGIGTIASTYLLTQRSNHLPEGVLTPPISFLGCQSPEHEVYQIGFTITGLLLWASIHHWTRVIYPIMREEYRMSSRIMLLGGYIAAIGVIGQGIWTLEEDLLLKIRVEGFQQSLQTLLHQHLAAGFFLGAALHCYATIYYCLRETFRSNATSRCLFHRSSVHLKTLCVILSFLSFPIAEFFHPARTHSLNRRAFSVAGLAQYLTVGSYIFFFGSYALDFAYLKKDRSCNVKQD